MGYVVHQRQSRFALKAANIPVALAAANEYITKWGGKPQTDLIAVLREDRLIATVDPKTGDIVALGFSGQKWYQELDEADTLYQIAAQVEAGSFFEMEGEDGVEWRWDFDGKTVQTMYLNDIQEPDEVDERG